MYYIRRLLLSRKGSFSCLSVPMCENEYVNRTSFKHRDWVGVQCTRSLCSLCEASLDRVEDLI